MPLNNGVMLTELWETLSHYGCIGVRLLCGLVGCIIIRGGGLVFYLFRKCGELLSFIWNLIIELWNRRRLAEERETLHYEMTRYSNLTGDREKRNKKKSDLTVLTELERQKAEAETNIKNWLKPEAHAFAELIRKRNRVIGTDDQLHKEDLDENKRVANEYLQKTIRVLTGMAEEHLHKLLVVSDQRSGNDSKQLYSPYGLLLSAHDSQILEENVEKQMVLRRIGQGIDSNGRGERYSLYLQSHKSKIEARCVDPSLSLVRSMLTLLPPLLITQPVWQHDDIQDTNRLTWNEEQRGRPLIYYRPVLVYGNHLSQLSVATRGLVGNSTTTVKERETSHQYLVPAN